MFADKTAIIFVADWQIKNVFLIWMQLYLPLIVVDKEHQFYFTWNENIASSMALVTWHYLYWGLWYECLKYKIF